MIKIFGHKSPDTDATCSAIIWSWYINNHTSEKAEAYVLGKLNKETIFVLNHFQINEPLLLEKIDENDTVIIVDTNNKEELFDNINSTNIKGIIDHHRLTGNIETKSPVNITIKTHASTATVMYDMLIEKNIKIDNNMKGLILSCVLSDTLMFRSPTTTAHDKSVAETLANDINIKIEDFAKSMFDAKSDISDFTDLGLINIDAKKTPVGDKNLLVSVIETTNTEQILDRKDGIFAEILKYKQNVNDIDEILFFIIDILKEEAIVFVNNDNVKDILQKSFDINITNDTYVLPGVLSRKKQIVPVLKV